jgi:hypothetical protein
MAMLLALWVLDAVWTSSLVFVDTTDVAADVAPERAVELELRVVVEPLVVDLVDPP